MLYCDDCAKPGWPITTRQTMARCDLCLEPRLCNDIDARAMPEARAAREELIEQLGDADVYSQLLRAKVSLAVMLGTVAARSAVGDEAYDLLIASFRDQLVANVTEQAELVGAASPASRDVALEQSQRLISVVTTYMNGLLSDNEDVLY